MDLGVTPVRALKSGDTQTLKLDAGLRLCTLLGASPYGLAGEPEPAPDLFVESDRVKVAVSAATTAGTPPEARELVDRVRSAIESAGFTVTKPIGGPGEIASRLPDQIGQLRAEVRAELTDLQDRVLAETERLHDQIARLATELASRESASDQPRKRARST